MLEGLDPTVAEAFERTLDQLRNAGAHVVEIKLPELEELAGLNANGGLPAAESFAWHQELLNERGNQYDPRVRARILRGLSMSASDYLHLLEARQAWMERLQIRISGFDAVLSPTVPIVAPPIQGLAPGEQRDDAFFRINAMLLRNPSVVNNLDGCAISLPCHQPDELPVGLMLWSTAMQDDTVLNLAIQVEAALAVHE
jgi:amidase/aspartyl-tRNA(Asn)/glutamyl-tRNA(Gln) amidotransferase subunit A